jgi:hypothetical protein
MRFLPIGIQSFSELRAFDGIYVDKTRMIHDLLATGKYYFMARPRRFGKSLLVSTLKEIFKGNKELFEGLWIENHWNWALQYPVVHLSFDAIEYKEITLAEGLGHELKLIADQHGFKLEAPSLKLQFRELIQGLHKRHGQVVLLIDEYDKPILDYLEKSKTQKAKENQDTLREFYGVVKSADEYLRFVFITGISKFSRVSIFSHLNNLFDITLNPQFSTLLGYTQEELEHYFASYLELIAEELQLSKQALMGEIKTWYNGYSWDGQQKVYNPFGSLNFFYNKEFRNYWFASGSPKFLIEQMRNNQFYNFENREVDNTTFERFDVENVDLVSLFFLSGYLTIKKKDRLTGRMLVDYPNQEVRESMYKWAINDLVKNPNRENIGRTIEDLREAFLQNDLKKVHVILNAILADLPSEVFQHQSEGLYHGLVHLVFSYLGMFVQSEVHSSQGRADAVVQTADCIFIFEFKFNQSADAAIYQISEKKYADKYLASGKPITGIGVNFSTSTKGIDEWKEVSLNS